MQRASHEPSADLESRGAGAIAVGASLAMGAGVSGLAAFGFLTLGTRTFGQEAFAPAGVVWSSWAMAAAAFTLPVEQWLSKLLQERTPRCTVDELVYSLWLAGLVAMMAVGVGSWVLRDPLFGHDGWALPVLMGATWMGALFMGLARGQLSGHERYHASAVLFALENLARLAIGGGVVLTDGGVVAFTVAVPTGSLVALLWLTGRPRRVRLRGRALAPVLALIGASSIAQVVLTSGPVVAALLGAAPAQITALFTALAIFRAPYQIVGGFSGRITVGLSQWRLRDPHGAPRVLARRIVLGGGAVALLTWPMAAVVGGPLIAFVFGDVVVGQQVVVLTAVATTIALATFVGSIGLVATGQTGSLLRVWVVAVIAGGAVTLGAPGGPEVRVALALLLAEMVGLVGIAVTLHRSPSSRA